jgi:hypothetical protein
VNAGGLSRLVWIENKLRVIVESDLATLAVRALCQLTYHMTPERNKESVGEIVYTFVFRNGSGIAENRQITDRSAVIR